MRSDTMEAKITGTTLVITTKKAGSQYQRLYLIHAVHQRWLQSVAMHVRHCQLIREIITTAIMKR